MVKKFDQTTSNEIAQNFINILRESNGITKTAGCACDGGGCPLCELERKQEESTESSCPGPLREVAERGDAESYHDDEEAEEIALFEEIEDANEDIESVLEKLFDMSEHKREAAVRLANRLDEAGMTMLAGKIDSALIKFAGPLENQIIDRAISDLTKTISGISGGANNKSLALNALDAVKDLKTNLNDATLETALSNLERGIVPYGSMPALKNVADTMEKIKNSLSDLNGKGGEAGKKEDPKKQKAQTSKLVQKIDYTLNLLENEYQTATAYVKKYNLTKRAATKDEIEEAMQEMRQMREQAASMAAKGADTTQLEEFFEEFKRRLYQRKLLVDFDKAPVAEQKKDPAEQAAKKQKAKRPSRSRQLMAKMKSMGYSKDDVIAMQRTMYGRGYYGSTSIDKAVDGKWGEMSGKAFQDNYNKKSPIPAGSLAQSMIAEGTPKAKSPEQKNVEKAEKKVEKTQTALDKNFHAYGGKLRKLHKFILGQGNNRAVFRDMIRLHNSQKPHMIPEGKTTETKALAELSKHFDDTDGADVATKKVESFMKKKINDLKRMLRSGAKPMTR